MEEERTTLTSLFKWSGLLALLILPIAMGAVLELSEAENAFLCGTYFLILLVFFFGQKESGTFP